GGANEAGGREVRSVVGVGHGGKAGCVIRVRGALHASGLQSSRSAEPSCLRAEYGATGVEPATSSLGICLRMQARRGPLLRFRGLPCGVRAPRCPRILRRTTTETATGIELSHGLVQRFWGQVRVA